MRLEVVLIASAAALAAGGTAMAHHSFAMFDQVNPIEIAGTVVEFRYTSPHSFILVDVKGKTAPPRYGIWKAPLRAFWPATACPPKRLSPVTSWC